MRQDQYERLQALSEQLMDVFLEEGTPASWPGHGLASAAMDAKTRGDRYWVKKNAAATGMLFTRVESMIVQQQGPGTTPPLVPGAEPADGAETAGDGEQLDAEIARAERQAAKLLDEMRLGTRKRDFDARTHGKS